MTLLKPSDLTEVGIDLPLIELQALCSQVQRIAESSYGANRRLDKNVCIASQKNAGNIVSLVLMPIWNGASVKIETFNYLLSDWQFISSVFIDYELGQIHLPFKLISTGRNKERLRVTYTTGFDLNLSQEQASLNPTFENYNKIIKNALLNLAIQTVKNSSQKNVSAFELKEHYKVNYFETDRVLIDGNGGSKLTNTLLEYELSDFYQFRPRFFSS